MLCVDRMASGMSTELLSLGHLLLSPSLQLLHPDPSKRLHTANTMRAHPFFEELSWKEVEEKTVIPSFIPPVSHSYFYNIMIEYIILLIAKPH